MLFLLLELAALVVVINRNSYQSAKFYSWSLASMGSVHEKQNRVSDYFSLRLTNEQLAEENAILKELLIKGGSSRTMSLLSIQDPLADKNIDFIPAKVVNGSVNKQHNIFTINAGSEDSIAVDMAVIGPLGVVGVVKSVSQHYAMVLPIVNVEYRVSSKLKGSNYFGTLKWDTNNYRFASLEGIEQHVNISVGDTVVTSGFGAVFPEGAMVGIIEAIIPGEEGVFHDIKVSLATDFKRLSYVYVMYNAHQKERISLENSTKMN